MKYSKQRNAIFEAVQSLHNHPTAQDVFQVVRKQIPTISLATVYRNLNALADSGQIVKLPLSQGPDRFDRVMQAHGHIICVQCGSVYDFPAELYYDLHTNLSQSTGFICTNYPFTMYGICKQCQTSKK